MFTNIKNKKIIFIVLILVLAAFLRLTKLDIVPPSLSWDEAAVGYNAWTIANYAKDEYGKFLPPFFRSFGDNKHPVHIYITAVSTKLLGLNEFSTRSPAAFFGVLNVLLIYFLAKLLFKKEIVSLAAAFFLAISPYNIHFSRFNHEVNFALFFFLLGLYLFLKGLEKANVSFPLSFLSFGLCILAYHSSKVVVPPIMLILILTNFRKILALKKLFVSGLIIMLFFIIIIATNPSLLGIARVEQNIFSTQRLHQTNLYHQTKNELLAWLEITYHQYWWHFTPQYLFITGDKNARLSSQTGEFYKLDAIFLILGLLYLLRKRSKEGMVLLTWALVAPLPSALVAEAPHAARAMYMMGSWHLISALGLYSIIVFTRNLATKWIIIVITLTALVFSLSSYLSYYYEEYAKRYAIEWQYGMKQIVEYVKLHPEYEQVFMTDARSQPYIFFLYYLKTPLPQHLNSVIYNNSESKSYNTVTNFDRYYFGGWDPIESFPNKGVLYIVTPSQYDGLRHKALFNVKRKISYPNGLDAFYLVSLD